MFAFSRFISIFHHHTSKRQQYRPWLYYICLNLFALVYYQQSIERHSTLVFLSNMSGNVARARVKSPSSTSSFLETRGGDEHEPSSSHLQHENSSMSWGFLYNMSFGPGHRADEACRTWTPTAFDRLVTYSIQALHELINFVDLPSAADLYVPSLPGLPDMATHPTHPLNIYAGMLPSYPGEGKGGGEGETGKDAKL